MAHDNTTTYKINVPYVKYVRVIVDSTWRGVTEFFAPTASETDKFDMLAILDPSTKQIIDFVLPMSAFGRNVGKLIVTRVGDQAEYVRIHSDNESDHINRYLYIAGGYGKSVDAGGDACIEEISRVSSRVVRMFSWHKGGGNEDSEYIEFNN